MKHTKGQWYTSGESINIADQHLVIDEETGQTIATCYGVSSEEEAKANAHLIAAAPELLEVCKSVLYFKNKLSPRVQKLIHEAINKAQRN